MLVQCLILMDWWASTTLPMVGIYQVTAASSEEFKPLQQLTPEDEMIGSQTLDNSVTVPSNRKVAANLRVRDYL